MHKEPYRVPIDGERDLVDLNEFPRIYRQLYSVIYSFEGDFRSSRRDRIDEISRTTGSNHRIQAKVAGELDGIASLTAAVEANLGVALIAETSRLSHGRDCAVLSLRVIPAPAPIVIAAGVLARSLPPPHVLAFIAEMTIVVSHPARARQSGGASTRGQSSHGNISQSKCHRAAQAEP